MPYLSALRYKLLQRARAKGSSNSTSWTLEALPYNLEATRVALFRFIKEQHVLLAKHEARLPGTSTLVPAAREIYPTYFAIDAFLFSARRAQNDLVSYLNELRPPGKRLPKNFNKMVAQLKGEERLLPESLACCLVDYWESHGKRLKDYRDLIVHHILVGDHVFLFERDGEPRILLRLTTNPEDKDTPRKLRFGRPDVHAQDFVLEQFEALLRLVHQVSKMLNDALGGGLQFSTGFHPRGATNLSDMSGVQPLSAGDLALRIRETTRLISAEAVPPITIEKHLM